MAASMRSVWSRERSGSRTAVSPSANSAANSRALLTCALATPVSTSQPTRRDAETRTGACPSQVSIFAPSLRSGCATRSIGRLERDSSPRRVTSAPQPAASPINRRMVVPLLPQ